MRILVCNHHPHAVYIIVVANAKYCVSLKSTNVSSISMII